VALIANGYRTLSYVLLSIYVVPLLTYGSWYLVAQRSCDHSGSRKKMLPPNDGLA